MELEAVEEGRGQTKQEEDDCEGILAKLKMMRGSRECSRARDWKLFSGERKPMRQAPHAGFLKMLAEGDTSPCNTGVRTALRKNEEINKEHLESLNNAGWER